MKIQIAQEHKRKKDLSLFLMELTNRKLDYVIYHIVSKDVWMRRWVDVQMCR